MPAEKVWRWWNEAPPSTVLKEASAREYLLLLADYAKEFYEKVERHPPIGFLFRQDGAVTVVPDLDDLPKAAWAPALRMLSADTEAEFYVIICEATVAVMTSAKEAEEAAQTAKQVSDLKNAREGVLLILFANDADTKQMLFMPALDGKKLGEVELPASPESFN